VTSQAFDPAPAPDPPAQACPRCRAGLWEGSGCDVCGLRFQCPSCGSRLRQPAVATICSVCDTPIVQPDADAAAQEADGGIGPSEPPPGGGRRLADVLAEVLPQAAAPLGVRAARAELGRALHAAGRPQAAEAEYLRALDEPGDDRVAAGILLERSRIADEAGRPADALRTAFEAVLADPYDRGALLGPLTTLIDATFAEQHGDWLAGPWTRRLGAAPLPDAVRADAAVAGLAVAIQLGSAEQAAARVAEALQADDARTRDLLPDVLEHHAAEAVGALAGPPGGARLALASGWAAIGQDARAMAECDAVIGGALGDDLLEAGAYELRAELRERDGEPAGAAADLVEAGIRLGWAGRVREAVDLLEEAERRLGALGTPSQRLYWFLCDNRRLLADPTLVADLQARDDLLEGALEAWRLGCAMGPPTGDEAWAYLSHASILETRGDVRGEKVPAAWRALVDAEAFIAQRPDMLEGWTFLTRLSRTADLGTVSLHAAARAMELVGETFDPQEASAVIEALVTRILWDPEAARPMLSPFDQAYGADFGDFGALIGALDRVRASDPEGAARYLAAADANDFGGRIAVTTEWVRAVHHLVAGDREDGLAAAERIIVMTDPGARFAGYDYRSERAWALLLCGRAREADALVRELCRQLGTHERTAEVWSKALLMAVRQGDEAGLARAVDGLAAAPVSPGDLTDLELELRCLEAVLPEGPDGDGPRRLVARARELVAGRVTATPPSDDPAAALAEVERAMGAPAAPGGDVPAACGLRRASLLREMGRWAEAARTAAEVVAPENPDAAEHIARTALGELLGEVGAQMRAGRVDEAAALLRSLRDLPPGPAVEDAASDAAAAEALLALLGDGDLEARRRLVGAALSAAEDEEHAATALGGVWGHLLPGAAQYWAVDDGLEAIEASAGDPGAAAQVRALRAALAPSLGDALGGAAGVGEAAIPAVLPVALELGAGMIPADAVERWAEWSLFTELIPAMRDRIAAETGVPVPGIRVRGNDALAADAYRILVEESFRAEGAVLLGHRFCPGAAAVPEDERALAARVPLGGGEGAWVAPETAEALAEAGVVVWAEEVAYPMAHLEAVLRGDLAPFLGLDETVALIEGWREDPSLEPLVGRAAADGRGRALLEWVAQRLAAERVPLADPRPMLDVLATAGAETDRWEALRAVRLAMRSALPGRGAAEVRVPPAWEAAAILEGGRPAVSADATLAMVGELAEGVAAAGPGGAAIVVERPELRPAVRRATRAALPDTPVLAREELADGGPPP
jgi:tetratricopeptide (TPR) repeat protein